MERIVRFQSENKELLGILHTPERVRSQSVGIIMTNVWVKYRVGPHRMFVQAARQWSREGFHVLRVDFPGMGDSEGDNQYLHMNAYPISIPLDAMRYLKEQEGVEKTVLFGVCSGARNMLCAAGASPDVHYLILLSFPFNNISILSPTSRSLKNERFSPVFAKNIMIEYIKRLLKLNAWKRLVSGESDLSFPFMARMIGSIIFSGQNSIFQERVHIIMQEFFKRRGQAFFLFGGSDPVFKDFIEEFQKVKSKIPGVNSLSEIRVIRGANHTFDRVVWKEEALGNITEWLNRQFPIQ